MAMEWSLGGMPCEESATQMSPATLGDIMALIIFKGLKKHMRCLFKVKGNATIANWRWLRQKARKQKYAEVLWARWRLQMLYKTE